MNGPTVLFRRKLGVLVAATLLTLPAGAIELAPPAAANSTATAPQQLVHAYPLGTRRLCCTGRTATRPRPGRASRAAPRPGGTRPAGTSNPLPIILLGGVLAVLLIAGTSATYGARRRRAAAALGVEIAASRRATTEVASSAATADRGGRTQFGRPSPFGERVTPSRDEIELPVGSTGGTEAEIAALERAYRPAPAGKEATDAFNLGVLFHQRRHLAAAREAYERAERRGDGDAGFNLGVLLYQAGDLDGAEAAWRRCSARGHPQAAANLRFLMQQRATPDEAAQAAGTESAERAYRRADQPGEAAGAFNLGVLLHQRGDLAGAREAYERAERRGDPDAAFNLGVLLYETGQPRKRRSGLAALSLTRPSASGRQPPIPTAAPRRPDLATGDRRGRRRNRSAGSRMSYRRGARHDGSRRPGIRVAGLLGGAFASGSRHLSRQLSRRCRRRIEHVATGPCAPQPQLAATSVEHT